MPFVQVSKLYSSIWLKDNLALNLPRLFTCLYGQWKKAAISKLICLLMNQMVSFTFCLYSSLIDSIFLMFKYERWARAHPEITKRERGQFFSVMHMFVLLVIINILILPQSSITLTHYAMFRKLWKSVSCFVWLVIHVTIRTFWVNGISLQIKKIMKTTRSISLCFTNSWKTGFFTNFLSVPHLSRSWRYHMLIFYFLLLQLQVLNQLHLIINVMHVNGQHNLS